MKLGWTRREPQYNTTRGAQGAREGTKKEGSRSSPPGKTSDLILVNELLDADATAAADRRTAGGGAADHAIGSNFESQVAREQIAEAKVGHRCVSMSKLEVADGDYVSLEARQNVGSVDRLNRTGLHDREAVRARDSVVGSEEHTS